MFPTYSKQTHDVKFRDFLFVTYLQIPPTIICWLIVPHVFRLLIWVNLKGALDLNTTAALYLHAKKEG